MNYKSNFLKMLQDRMNTNPFFYLTGTKEEKEYIRENNCTYKTQVVYGGIKAIIKDKKTKEIIEIVIY